MALLGAVLPELHVPHYLPFLAVQWGRGLVAFEEASERNEQNKLTSEYVN